MNVEINDAAAWLKQLSKVNIPVLRQTARALAKLEQDEDNLSARDYCCRLERPVYGV